MADAHDNQDLVIPHDEDSISFVRGLVERGEAVTENQGGVLAPKVTHLIVGKTDAGDPIVKRVRFSAF